MEGQSQLVLILILLMIALGMGACKQENPTPIVPSGDPVVAARDFLNTFYSEDVRACTELFADEIRDEMRRQCQVNADRRASIDLSEAIFTVVSRRGTTEVMIELTGRWTITALNLEGQPEQDIHDTTTEEPLAIVMIYENGEWVFNYFPE